LVFSALAFSHDSTSVCQIPASSYSGLTLPAPASIPLLSDRDAVDSANKQPFPPSAAFFSSSVLQPVKIPRSVSRSILAHDFLLRTPVF
jgi:hypothetical protein